MSTTELQEHFKQITDSLLLELYPKNCFLKRRTKMAIVVFIEASQSGTHWNASLYVFELFLLF